MKEIKRANFAREIFIPSRSVVDLYDGVSGAGVSHFLQWFPLTTGSFQEGPLQISPCNLIFKTFKNKITRRATNVC